MAMMTMIMTMMTMTMTMTIMTMLLSSDINVPETVFLFLGMEWYSIV
jgi:hypothetical protein